MSEQLTEAGPQTRVAAFFDFDGTVIDGYSAVALLKERARHGQIGLAEAVRLTLAGVGAALGRAEVEDFLRVGVAAFEGTSMAALDEMGDRLTTSVLGGFLFPEAVARIAEHRKKGHLVVLATSALPFQVEPLARELGVDHVLCTRLGQVDGVCTGVVDGPMLWGPAKAHAVQGLADAEGIDLAASYGYANGDEDVDFLQVVGHPTAVNPGALLEAVARQGDWPVVRFAPKAKGSVLDLPRTVAAYSGLAAACVVGAGLGLLNRSRRVAANTSLSVGSEVALSLAGVRVEVTGEQHLWERRPAVFLFNHQSLLDPLVVFNLLQHDVTSVGKKEVASTPLVGQFAWLINAALVDRADIRQAKQALQPAVDKLKDGYSIAIAPEGTRSITAAVGPFKKGPFHLAMQGGVPIVPIVLRNTGELQWRGSRVIRSGTVDALVLPPIDVSGWDPRDLTANVAAVRQLYVDALADWPSATR
jgi:putative phosphoserine phosphatase/1-acylglycerol-3-phosphate O-acyltransferase